ncbi:MAG: hypothetical protein RI958_2317 [Actinomycetota bacterium]|jgi:acyl-coenzyme A thioesterase PaaI-like protein
MPSPLFEFDSTLDPSDARIGLAAAARSVIAELASSSASAESFREARRLVEQAAAVLERDPHDRPYSHAEASIARQNAGEPFLEYSPIVGVINPLAAPVEVRIEGDSVIGEVTFGLAYEGPPGCVHGGTIAAAFDEVLGLCLMHVGMPGMTARLEVSYRSPTPIGHPLRFTANLDRIEGRKIFATGQLHAGDRLCAEASALFISMDQDLFQSMIRDRAAGAD